MSRSGHTHGWRQKSLPKMRAVAPAQRRAQQDFIDAQPLDRRKILRKHLQGN